MGRKVSSKLARQLFGYLYIWKKANTVFSMLTSKYLLLLTASFKNVLITGDDAYFIFEYLRCWFLAACTQSLVYWNLSLIWAVGPISKLILDLQCSNYVTD